MQILSEGMSKFGDRLGVAGMKLEASLLDEYSKEKILKDHTKDILLMRSR